MLGSSFAAVLAMALGAAAKTVTYDWNATWVVANPDGLYDRTVIGINNEWPLPIVEVDKGDRLIVTLHNGLGNKSTSIHWHGMFQNGTNHMDGPSMVTQCPVAPGSSMVYNFTIDQNGTYWYHCHTDYCYPDGYRQALIVHDADAPFINDFKEEFYITMSDWYHTFLQDLSHQFMSLYNPSGAEPIPDSFLVNDALNVTMNVEAGETYMLRLINTAAFVAQYFYIPGYNFTIVEVDGVYVEPQEADSLYIPVAQRYSILVTIKNGTTGNIPMVFVADADLLDVIPSKLQLNQSAYLVIDNSTDLVPAAIEYDVCDDIVPYDDIQLVPSDGVPLFQNANGEADHVVNLTLYMVNLMTGYNYAMFDNITYTAPKVPSLYTALSSGSLINDSTIYGEYTHPFVLKHNEIVEIIINNADSGTHPFHLHGHNFQIIDRAPGYGADFYEYLNYNPVPYDNANHTAFPAVPVRRDVATLPAQGYMVLRFIADNPGVWIFHCHIDWHLASGLALIFIEAPDLIPTHVTIPEDHYAACAAASVPSAGNAAANTENFLDLSGQPKQPNTIPDGFTTKGRVAMAFSCLSALLGIASLAIYGMADIKNARAPQQITVPNGGVTGETASDEVATKSG